MRTHPPSFQQGKGSYQRFDRFPPPTTVLYVPRGVLQLEGGNISSHTVRTDDESDPIQPLDIEPSLVSGRDELVSLAGQLQFSLSTSCPWFGQKDIKIIGTKPIDVGCFSEVWMGEMGDQSVAIKSLRYWTSADSETVYKRFQNEVLVCSQLSDQNIVRFLGVYSTPARPFALAFEFMYHRNLKAYLSENCGVRRLDLVLEIAYAIKYLHDKNIIHGNIKISNILVGAGGHIRVGGFGAASGPLMTSGVDVDRLFYGAAPELIDPQLGRAPEAGVTKASDMFAFSVLVWEVFGGRVAFSGENMLAGVYSILKGHRPARPDYRELSDGVWKVIKGCWQGNPAKRMTITEAIAILNEEANAHSSY